MCFETFDFSFIFRSFVPLLIFYFREEHHCEMKEKNESLIELGKKLADLRMHATNREDRDVLQHTVNFKRDYRILVS